MDWMAIILAGGVGSRLFPLTKERPKPLVPIANRPMIDYAVESLRKAGITKIVIAVKYLGDQIREWFDKQNYDDLEIIIPKNDSKDTADAVRLCAEYIDCNFIVTMSDIVTNLDISEAIRFHEQQGQLATICLKPVETPGQFGLTMLDNDSRIHLFLEKPSPTELYMTTMTFTGKSETLHMHHNLANIGVYAFNIEMRDIIVNYGDLMDFGKHVFPFLLDHKYDVKGFLSQPYWMDAGTIEKYIWTNNDVAKRWSFPYIPNENEERESIWIGDQVKIGKNSQIIPPAVMGKGTKIGDNCKIGPNVTIGENALIGNGVTISESVLWSNVSISDNANMELSVIASNVNIQSENIYKKVVPSNLTLTVENQEQYSWK